MRDAPPGRDLAMRTTLTIDDDTMLLARERADMSGEPIGKMISDMARKSLDVQQVSPEYDPLLGIKLLPVSPNARPGTLEEVNRLRDEME